MPPPRRRHAPDTWGCQRRGLDTACDRPRVVLHVGTPRSGTGFLASSLRQHRDVLREGASGSRPDAALDDLVAVGERWVREVRRSSYAVHGDLSDLVPGAAPISVAAVGL